MGRACCGEQVLEHGDMAECAECGTRVQWDLRDDPFWGFGNCPEAVRDTAGRYLAPRQTPLAERPSGPWDGNGKDTP